MKILVADDDPISALVLEGLLEASGHTCEIARDGDAAWAIIQGDDPPRIMFLDWMMPGLDGLELCRRTRALERRAYTYIVIVSARNRQEEINLGFAAGADDFITKPYQPEEVFARQRVAERVIQRASAEGSMESAIQEAQSSPAGDVVVRSGAVVGRIIFRGGKVLWAALSDRPSTPAVMLANHAHLDSDELQAAEAESKSKGLPLTKIVLQWDLIPEDELRALTRSWICRQLAAISHLESPTVIFNPIASYESADLLFDYDELTALRLLPASPPREPDPEIERPANSQMLQPLDADELTRARADLAQLMQLSGVLSVAIFDERTGRWLLTHGEKVDLDLAWRNVKLAVAAHAWDEVEDIIITTRGHIYTLRLYSQSPRRFIFLASERANSRLGMLRLALASCGQS